MTDNRAQAHGFDAVELDIIKHGDMLGSKLGERVFEALTAPGVVDGAHAREAMQYSEMNDTAAEVAHFAVVEDYIRDLLAKPSSLTDDEKTLIAGNIRGFYVTAFPFQLASTATELLAEAEGAIEEYSCRTPIPHIATEMEGLAARIRVFLSGKSAQVSDAQKYLDALESIDAVAVDFGHFESAARTMQEIAHKAITEVAA